MQQATPAPVPLTGRIARARPRAHAAAQGAGRSLRRAGQSTRFRILAWMLVVTALGMVVAGAVTFTVQRQRILDRVDDRLQTTIDGLQFIADGNDAANKKPPATVDDFLTAAMQRVLPDRTESVLGFVDGVPTYVPSSGIAFRLDQDSAFVRLVQSTANAEHPVRGTTESQFGTLRYVIIPVTIKDDPHLGLYVSAYDLDDELQQLRDSFGTYALISLAVLVLVGAVGWIVAGRLLRPIRLLQAAASAATGQELSHRVPVTGNDEVSHVAATFNDMLDRLEGSFRQQRQLLDDVSHELRTPITIVRGHLELLDPTRADEVQAARELAIDELDRMQALVHDIATLAKTNAPDFVRVAPTWIDEFADAVAGKAQALDPDRHWVLRCNARGRFLLDRARITQAWLQLAENAVKYSPPGCSVELGCEAVQTPGGRMLALSVRDHGRGIPEAQLGRIFERFARAEPGRGVEGSGLGLSIVAAIAAAHGGSADARNAIGGGAVVTITIPAVEADAPAAEGEK